MNYDIEELLTTAITIDKPMIIVEGSDDVKIYENIIEHIDRDYDVYAIENIKDYSEGCEEVIRAIADLQLKINESERNDKYILGIIDADVRQFRNTIPNLKCIFVLKYYSFESHFISRSNLKVMVGEVTNNGNTAISKEVLDYCESDLEKHFKELYYYSLESLKNALVVNYNSVIGYSASPGLLFSQHHWAAIKTKKRNLDYFAKKHTIKYDLKTLKRIAKGKWLLFYYSSSVLNRLKTLKDACKDNKLPQCQFCKCSNHNKCLRKLNSNYNVDLIQKKLSNYYDKNELKYIYDRLLLLNSIN